MNHKKIVLLLAIFILVGTLATVYGVNFIGKNQGQNNPNCPYNGQCVNNGTCLNDQCPYKNNESQISINNKPVNDKSCYLKLNNKQYRGHGNGHHKNLQNCPYR
jgi:hypothetical protein